ncbi:unnamed protein product [Prunus armeniaca]|uniref:Retrotransposon Copia-like N-terminal domain-containing protein n=1 Tax=Prunus armeniaca TaxID=36596 RepID=A0A6J5US95_PRUAR|nr:unnamed protein product [Prunus armeniaca]
MASSSVPTISIPNISHLVSVKLSDTNYLVWESQVQPFLLGQNLWRFVDGSHPCPSPTLPPYDKSESSTPSLANPLKFRLFSITKGSKSISEYLAQAKSLADELTAIQEPVSNSDLVTYVLRGLGIDYQMIVMAILNFPPLPSFSDLRTRLLAFEGQQP